MSPIQRYKLAGYLTSSQHAILSAGKFQDLKGFSSSLIEQIRRDGVVLLVLTAARFVAVFVRISLKVGGD